MQPNVVSPRENNLCSSTITKKKVQKKKKNCLSIWKAKTSNPKPKPQTDNKYIESNETFLPVATFSFLVFFILQVSDTNKSVCLPDSHKVSSKAAHQTDTIIKYVYYFVPHAYPPSSTYRKPNRINTIFNGFSNLFHFPFPQQFLCVFVDVVAYRVWIVSKSFQRIGYS